MLPRLDVPLRKNAGSGLAITQLKPMKPKLLFALEVSWGRFLNSESITIGYKLFYWSRHFCPISRADPVFLSFSVSWISEGPVFPSHQPQQVYAWDAEITAYVGYIVSSLGALLLRSRGFR